ncbi:PQQ-like beta-propeller repeat protein [Micromonospora sp. R77]|uniref:outer membrane protein assembly factor BamB family protein n=1 Tax=Micromonospora sp. R77 TaxID=2925836 RepID=UPI001F621759|nr:PQQ-binding-like beta-propeller repeat protein [Micromonospora sp. R77]MCI4062594.1 PQQ-like beta-propeller repeat protein [Micromonospora sp. R77]
MAVRWSRLLHLRSSPATMAAGPDVLVVAERHSRLVGLDPTTGTLRWEQRVEDCWGTTAVADGRCLHLSQTGVLHCFDLDNGDRLWSTPGLGLRRYVTVTARSMRRRGCRCGSTGWSRAAAP